MDMDTLTMAQGIATGKYHTAVLTHNAEWEAACVKTGRKCGDLVHLLVYCPELHFSEFTSAVADMKNSVAVGVGPACTSGHGLGECVNMKTSVPSTRSSTNVIQGTPAELVQ